MDVSPIIISMKTATIAILFTFILGLLAARWILYRKSEAIKDIYEKMQLTFQKVGVNKYDAFHEMGGELSFAITMLDENNTGWILNIMHSRQGCYAYVKDIVKGESTIQLAEEERESLEKAIFQEK